MDKSCRLVLIDPVVQGHHSAYLGRIAREAIKRSYEVVLVAPPSIFSTPHFDDDALNQRLRGTFLPLFSEAIVATPRTQPIIQFWNVLSASARTWLTLRKISREIVRPETDIVVSPYIDNFSYVAALIGSPFGRAHWVGISMRSPVHAEWTKRSPRIAFSSLKAVTFSRLARLSTLKCLFLIDRLAYSEYSRSTRWAGKVCFLPDPVDPLHFVTGSIARNRMQIPENAVSVLVYGSITGRKGIRLLLECLQSPGFPRNVHLLIAGEQDPEATELISTLKLRRDDLRTRMTEINRRLSKEEEASAFAASDIVWLVYENHMGMSGVLVQAGQAGLPSIVPDEGLMAWYADNEGVGLRVENNAASALSAIACLANNQNLRNAIGARARLCFELHTVSEFNNALFNKIDSITGMGPP